MNILLRDKIATSFYELHRDIKENKYLEYFIKGGRGSTKSSFTSLEIVFNMIKDAKKGLFTNAVVIRKVKDTLKTSVFEQISWAIHELGLQEAFYIPESKLAIVYLPTGQTILFRGADDPTKIKSLKFKRGYCAYLWYEELDEFTGMQEIRNMNQSLLRGGEKYTVFYTYNPPKSGRSWVNIEAKILKENRKIHHSDYRDVPKHWLGNVFLIEAEHLKKVNMQAYRHEYLGEEVGTGLEVFNNVTIRTITDEEIKEDYDNIRQGLDFGYAVDPVAFVRLHYDKKKKRIYIFDEFTGLQISNEKLFENIKQHANFLTYADKAEPKSIDALKEMGLRIAGAKKGPDSVNYGLKFLQDLEEIVIDSTRCPRSAKEFINYALLTDRRGEIKNKFPDADNHCIDSVRYSLVEDINNKSSIIFV